MTKYWAIDYVGMDECEPVIDDQLYATEDEARMALEQMDDDNQKYYEVNWYTLADLEDDIYDYSEISIGPDLVVRGEW